jgi:hypothetical protein
LIPHVDRWLDLSELGKCTIDLRTIERIDVTYFNAVCHERIFRMPRN